MDKIKNFYNNNKKTIIYPTVVMLLICIVITLALSVTDAVTAPKIAEITEKNTNSAVKDDKVAGYIFTVSEKGYGGDISVMVSVNPDCTVNTVQILDASNETPGLGQNVTKEEFYGQFEGKGYGVQTVKGGTKSAENEVDAVTSATISSKAVGRAVNKALGYAEKITHKKGGAK